VLASALLHISVLTYDKWKVYGTLQQLFAAAVTGPGDALTPHVFMQCS